MGFLVNRLLFTFFNEGWKVINEGAATPEGINEAVTFGLIQWALLRYRISWAWIMHRQDWQLSIGTVIYEESGERFKPSPLLKRRLSHQRHRQKGEKRMVRLYKSKGGQ
ncbi:MAG: 3-hydroxyacyl-CoA dehydrogenase family protein [Thermodesulfobacteriota bacterium]